MFSKQAKASKGPARIEPLPMSAAPVPEPVRKAPPKVASLISSDITIEGGVTGDGELQIDGVVRGDVRVGRLTVGETGHIEGSIYTEVVEVRAHDSVGLLHRLTHTLADLELDVRSARVSTLGAEVVDAFYVVEADGRPIDDAARRTDIERALLTACRPAS